jgi:hypothetical protein
MRSIYLAATAAMAVASIGLIDARPAVSHPAPTPTKRKDRREHHAVTTYAPKTPRTAADHERLRLAEERRARKAAKLQRDFAASEGRL